MADELVKSKDNDQEKTILTDEERVFLTDDELDLERKKLSGKS
jgi:hypothetical protein